MKGLGFAEQPLSGRLVLRVSEQMKDVDVTSAVTTDSSCAKVSTVSCLFTLSLSSFHGNEKRTLGLEVDLLSSMLHVYGENCLSPWGGE